MHSHSVHSQDVSIAYRVIGAGPRDVMLVHGWMVSGAVYDDLVGALDTEGLRLILVDLRGSGKSGRPQSGYTIEQYAKDVLAVADAVGSRKFMLVGHSMGGQI
ncbi:MAG TPA: alpha/beta hydrolase, partial [Pseudomonadota bacterium]|nr:alpha/beta hydrolase [Pseudomonadota bacterium]